MTTQRPLVPSGGLFHGTLFILLLLGLLPAFIAMNKGRNFLLWWFYGTVLFVVAIFHAITLKPTPEYLAEIGMRYCQDCDRIVKTDDPECPHHPAPPPSA